METLRTTPSLQVNKQLIYQVALFLVLGPELRMVVVTWGLGWG